MIQQQEPTVFPLSTTGLILLYESHWKLAGAMVASLFLGKLVVGTIQREAYRHCGYLGELTFHFTIARTG
ncbi:uncharacterized protein PHALS_10108 [Plasmopara halstedii]|uniref:Uncharacterized protein n=1 Tax=Plasmopara halstedii TaxID=4781 RepID=A0A0P1AHC2_PLAHL|nr:uncharacterized protein PHALS_10108 [Plasmopara halstedii]CEG39880.1 hypothetical protein PHALS_10108 [Plasmopara halstedii]|eukprot:XP_024576249.1 hypothetical protein PHALS_10108 [Plasmopara halstedii]